MITTRQQSSRKDDRGFARSHFQWHCSQKKTSKFNTWYLRKDSSSSSSSAAADLCCLIQSTRRSFDWGPTTTLTFECHFENSFTFHWRTYSYWRWWWNKWTDNRELLLCYRNCTWKLICCFMDQKIPRLLLVMNRFKKLYSDTWILLMAEKGRTTCLLLWVGWGEPLEFTLKGCAGLPAEQDLNYPLPCRWLAQMLFLLETLFGCDVELLLSGVVKPLKKGITDGKIICTAMEWDASALQKIISINHIFRIKEDIFDLFNWYCWRFLQNYQQKQK